MNNIASVIVLSYKKFDYIFDTIDSILRQDYSDIELIIADDGSENFPKDEIDSYVRCNKENNIVAIQIYSNSVNLGTVKNLNTAIKRSIGEYIINIAGDDIFFNDTVVSNVVKRLDNSKNGVITCRRLLCDAFMKPIRYMPTDFHITEIIKITLKNKQHASFIKGEFYELASGSCTYYKKKQLMEDGLFNERYRLLEDYSHFIEITRKKQIETAYDIISIFYRGGGISSSIPKVLLDDYLLMLKDEQVIFSNKLTLFEKRYLQYNLERFSANKSIFTHVKYFDAFISRVIYKIKSVIYHKKGVEQFNSKS